MGNKLAINPTHEAADAFWAYWNANGETHKHGYYESTWGAINAALCVAGVRSHDYGTGQCQVSPQGWVCSRCKGHEGPCAPTAVLGLFAAGTMWANFMLSAQTAYSSHRVLCLESSNPSTTGLEIKVALGVNPNEWLLYQELAYDQLHLVQDWDRVVLALDGSTKFRKVKIK